ncbi:hypothetical protein A8C32_19545 [Flavivirga aquatica]|uniref:Uncharacterized protein n=1 Tax=Flavivirga aquatica TaxID=1849968 RepID=A0A1E5T3Q7_9FLAO|nr:DUF4468 domain-containing protein [Flavivirga aquatica]OEK06023.1 hypothetical protein A8C32_19545 [Flavivirga aquatica]
MNRILTLSFLFLTCISFAQEFEITPNGLKDKSNTDNGFLVIKASDKKTDELYKNAIKYVNEKYKNPEKVIKGKTENEYLRFETYVGQLTKVNNSGVKLDISATYTTELRFKDGKVRYEIIELDMTADNGGRNVYWKGSIWKGYPIFNKKDELRLEKTKTDLEKYFNAQVQIISDFLNEKKSEKDDW